MGRLTDDDKQFGRIIYGKTSWDAFSIVWSSGGDEWEDTEEQRNDITVYCRGYVCRIHLPQILKPIIVDKGSYKISVARKYGFSLSDNFLHVHLGASYHDSDIDNSWSCFLPWSSWRYVQYRLFDNRGDLFYQWKYSTNNKSESTWEHKKDCPTVVFEIEDFDGARINAKTCIEERTWLRGEGWFKWLSWFYSPKVIRTLDIEFSEEVGPEKGSYKGGTIGHGIEMLPWETHRTAFERYCQQEHRSKYKPYRVKYVAQHRGLPT